MPSPPALFALLAALVPALAAAAGNTDPHDGHGAMHADGAHAELVEIAVLPLARSGPLETEADMRMIRCFLVRFSLPPGPHPAQAGRDAEVFGP